MRIRPWHVLIFVVLLALFSGWVSLPGTTLDIGGFKRQFPVREGLDLQGGLQVVLEAKPAAGQEVDADTLEGTRATLERRVNGLGVSEPLIQKRGGDQIIVELPGLNNIPDCLEDDDASDCVAEDIAELTDSNGDGTPDCLDDGDSNDCEVENLGPGSATSIIQETALLEIINPNGQFLPEGTFVNTSLGSADQARSAALGTPVAGTPLAGEASPVASPPAGAGESLTGPVYETIISGADLADAFITTGQTGFGTVVGFRLRSEAADTFFNFTSSHLGQPMSIVIDKQVISSPSINGAISNEGIIEGVPPDKVDDLVVQLKAGALAVPLEVVQSRTVGPILGQDAIDRSIIAGIIGLGAVALFMIAYYRLPGVLSVVALIIYTAVTFAVFKLIPVTLTLAGIAGFILSIGMAVDANVLIFSRLKEELRQGRLLSQAVELGFDHAWPSIRDSNISTMITTFILYLFGNYTGTSIITGFAITLFIGVVISLFTAITVTRTFLRLLIDTGIARHRWWFGVEPAPSAAAAD